MQQNIKLLSIILTIFLCGCKYTAPVWSPKIDRDEVAKDLLINKEDGSKIILVGKKYNYFLKDDSKMIYNLFQSNAKHNLVVDVDSITAESDEVKQVRFYFTAEKNKLSSKQSEFLKSMGALVRGRNDDILRIYDPDLPGYRVLSDAENSKYQTSKFTSTGFIKSDQQTAIFEDPTPLQITGKVLVTPFTLAIDIVRLPLTIPLFFYHQYRESRSDHFCEGEFCGYDKIEKKN